jgi:small subunit ribosomal protein S6
MREYEVAVIYHPDLEIDLDGARKKVEKVMTDLKATIDKADVWGKRKLAYPIEKQENGIYIFYRVTMPGENVAKLDQTLNITTEVIRHLIVKPGPAVVAAPVAEEEEAKQETSEEE